MNFDSISLAFEYKGIFCEQFKNAFSFESEEVRKRFPEPTRGRYIKEAKDLNGDKTKERHKFKHGLQVHTDQSTTWQRCFGSNGNRFEFSDNISQQIPRRGRGWNMLQQGRLRAMLSLFRTARFAANTRLGALLCAE